MSSPLPSRHDAWQMMRFAQVPDWVLGHVASVEALAVAMARAAKAQGHDVDEHLVQVGAILHDIGRAITQDPSHAHRGAEKLRDAGLPEAVVHIVERHTGAGIIAKEAPVLGIPAKDYTPQTLEERIVAHADNLYSGTKRLSLDDVKTKYEAKGLRDAYARIERLHAELCGVCGTDLERLEPAGLGPDAP